MLVNSRKGFTLEWDFATAYDVAVNEESEDSLRPEKGLWSAVLERAISDALGNVDQVAYGHAVLQRRAFTWITKSRIKLERAEVGSYSWICQLLDLDPYEIRRIIIKARRSKRKYLRDGRGRVRVERPLANY